MSHLSFPFITVHSGGLAIWALLLENEILCIELIFSSQTNIKSICRYHYQPFLLYIFPVAIIKPVRPRLYGQKGGRTESRT